MNKTLLITGVILASALAGCLVVGGYVLSTYNGAKTQHVLYEAKLKANTATFDNMWKKIQQVAQVTEAQKDALKDVLLGYAQARQGTGGAKDGSLARWVHEAVPNVDTSTFNNLQNIIAGSRDSWTFNQLELVDIAREYNRRLEVQPSGFILGVLGFKPINAKVITSSRTEETFITGKDDAVSVSPAKK